MLAELVDDAAGRLQAGEAVDVEALRRDHPEHADELRRAAAGAAGAGRAVAHAGERHAAGGRGGDRGTLGDFRIIREVGRGGMGVVYEAEQICLGRRVALKVLPFAATMDPRQLQRFHNEARAAASLHHEHIVPVYGVGCERGVHYYAMQFIDGLTLAEVIAPAAATEPRRARPRRTRRRPADTQPVAAAATPHGAAGRGVLPAGGGVGHRRRRRRWSTPTRWASSTGTSSRAT